MTVAAERHEPTAADGLAEVLSEFARTMVTDFPIQRILDHLVQRIVDILPVTSAGVTLISPGQDPRYVAASNRDALGFEQLQSELDQGPCVAAYQTNKSVSVPDLRVEPRFPAFTPRALEAGMEAVFTFPLSHGASKPLGALDLYRKTPGDLSPDEMTTAQTLADVAAAYLLNAQARADLQAASDQSREAALHDVLTGLPNRVLLLERVGHASLRRERSQTMAALVFIDLDRFKAINDTHGHSVGDELLIAIAERLPEVVRPGDTVARISGDEFVVFCEDIEDASEADVIVDRIRAAFVSPFLLSEVELSLTASLGVAMTANAQTSPEDLLRDADLAMYKDKRHRGGRSNVGLGDLKGALASVDLEEDLCDAVAGDQLCLDFQPIVDAQGSQIVGVEALLRWRHPQRGLIAPAVLIPLAERTGLIAEIGAWVLRQSLAERQAWRLPGNDALGLSVNVSPSQLLAAGFADSVSDAVRAALIDPARLTLEITESILERDPERAMMVLNDLKDIGIGIALDDFGTGYSSLSLLKRYPVDFLKIDREFVADLGHNHASRAILTAVLSLARSLDVKTVAEGVETAEQHRHLAAIGCDRCQGFYFARPMPASRLAMLIHRLDKDRRLPPA